MRLERLGEAVKVRADFHGGEVSPLIIKRKTQELRVVTRMAASEHVKRARDLEAQDQVTGAMAEYRLAADLDSTNTFALTKAMELERRMRDLAESSRPQARIENLRQQAAQTSARPRLAADRWKKCCPA